MSGSPSTLNRSAPNTPPLRRRPRMDALTSRPARTELPALASSQSGLSRGQAGNRPAVADYRITREQARPLSPSSSTIDLDDTLTESARRYKHDRGSVLATLL